MEEIVKVNSDPEFQAYMTYEEDQEKIQNSRIKAGIKQGLEQKSIEIARKLKEMGLELDKISLATDLSLEKLSEIFKED